MENEKIDNGSSNGALSPFTAAWKRFKTDWLALTGLSGIILMLFFAIAAPLIANGRPLLLYTGGVLSCPALHFIFAPDSHELIVEKIFNYLLLFVPAALTLHIFLSRKRVLYITLMSILALALLFPFILTKNRVDKRDWRSISSELKKGDFAVFAPIPYGPFENVAKPYGTPSKAHLFGTDQIGRDVLSRMLYGARVSLAVGFLATGIAMAIGIAVGMFSGYFGGRLDMLIMRIVEIIICFPTFLLLLILMAVMMDYKFEQSILLVIAVIGLSAWTGLSRLVRGEVLKQRALPYIQSCETLGIPVWRIMFFHLLPNVAGPILVTFTFSIAGAILAESGLSFLGFGVQDPTASWGELLRQAFSDPFNYWHLTLWPGLALFIAVCAFNFTGEGLRKVFDPRA